MLVKASELTGAALDWAVASSKGYSKIALTISGEFREFIKMHSEGYHNYSTDWSQGGPIIEREGILLRPVRKDGHNLDGQWLAMYDGGNTGSQVRWVDKCGFPRSYSKGQTPLIAAMRCYVTSRLGDSVEVPEGLTC